MTVIKSSVGDKCSNAPNDVGLSQALLNNYILFGCLKGVMPMLVMDGKCGPKTVVTIRVFQIMTGIFPPDGKMSPKGPTFAKLAGPLVIVPTSGAAQKVKDLLAEKKEVQEKIDDIEQKQAEFRRDYNLTAARAALYFTRGQLKYGAGNKWEDIKKSYGFSTLYGLWGRLGELGSDYDLQATIARSADSARAAGAGNCYEFGAVAFVYLQQKRVPRIALMTFKNADHVFVVVGLAKDATMSDPTTWGYEAAICDAWASCAYEGREFEYRMARWGGSASVPRAMLRR